MSDVLTTSVPSTPAARACLASEIDIEVCAVVASRMQAAGLEAGYSQKFLAGVFETFAFLDAAIDAIRRRGLQTWTLPILSWMSLQYVEWSSDAERQRTEALALGDQGALWWAATFEVALFNRLPPMTWNDFHTYPYAMTMQFLPAVRLPSLHDRRIELWALSYAPIRSALREPPGTWPHALLLRIHAPPRASGGSTRGAPPSSGLDIYLVEPHTQHDPSVRAVRRTYFTDSAVPLRAAAIGDVEPNLEIVAGVESIPDGSDPVSALILLATYADRHGLLSPREKDRARQLVESHLLGIAQKSEESPQIAPSI